jgi:hypothetical protein
MRRLSCFIVAFTVCAGSAFTSNALAADETVSREVRLAILKHAQLWMPTDVASKDIKAGPQGRDAFAPESVVTCEYVDQKLSGNSPKFACRIGAADEVKVRYGATNGEVYAGVAATRLLWALGFGADRLYPVHIVCRNCPADLPGGTPIDHAVKFDVAAIERKMGGREINTPAGEGWAWPELDLVDETAGGAPRAHRDALKLMAGLLQHTDNKPEQQRLVCLDKEEPKREGKPDVCAQPFLYIHDLGLTFGEAHWLNQQPVGSVNLERWARTPVWRDGERCVANVHASVTGSLEHPPISEEGRAFLAGLLRQLSDAQLRDLFEVARFSRRGVEEGGHISNGTVAEWVAAFKKKRDEIAGRRCDDGAARRGAAAATSGGAAGSRHD